MIWASLKATAFVGIAVATGVVCTSVPIGGRTISERLSETNGPHHPSSSAAPGRGHVEAGEAPTPSPGAPHPAHVDPHAVATVLPDSPTGDSVSDGEREAVAHLIQKRARAAKPARP